MRKPREKMFFKGNIIDSLDSFVVACDRDGYVFIGDKPVCSYYIGKNMVSKIILMIKYKRLSYANRNPKYIQKPKKTRIHTNNGGDIVFRVPRASEMLVSGGVSARPLTINGFTPFSELSWAHAGDREDDQSVPF